MGDLAIRQSGRVGRYLWALSQFAEEGRVGTTSTEISDAVGVNATQVRRDLSRLLGRTGKRGVGYDVRCLQDALRSQTTVLIVGDGPVFRHLGKLRKRGGELSYGNDLAVLGLVRPKDGELPTVAVLDYLDPEDGRLQATGFAHAGVTLIVNYGAYVVDAPPARVVNASPILALAEAVA